MIARRRLPLVLTAGAVAALVTTSCSTFSSVAASVDGHDIDSSDFDAALADVTEAGFIPVDEETGTLVGDGARAVLGLMVRDRATSEFLAAADVSITDDDRDAFLETITPEEQAQLEGMSDETSRLLVDNSAVSATLSRVTAPSAAELERRYEDRPVSTGVLCLRHILVASESEARDVLEELAAGADFAELAGERSIDEGTAANGGALGTDEEPCTDLDTARQTLDPQVLAGAFDARAGVPTGPVESDSGWHVVLSRPFAEIGTSLLARYETDAGNLGLAGALAAADVSVDPRYGSWDAASGAVVGLG